MRLNRMPNDPVNPLHLALRLFQIQVESFVEIRVERIV
jgi:hypothetical protein